VGPNKQGVQKILRLIYGGSKFEKCCEMTIKQQEEQKQIVVKRKTKINTEACYFSFKNGCEQYLQKKRMSF